MCLCKRKRHAHSCTGPLVCMCNSSFNFLYCPNCKNKMEMKEITRHKNFEHNSILPCTWCSNIMHIPCTKKYVSKIRYEHTHTHNTNTDIYRRNINELCGSKSIYDIIT